MNQSLHIFTQKKSMVIMLVVLLFGFGLYQATSEPLKRKEDGYCGVGAKTERYSLIFGGKADFDAAVSPNPPSPIELCGGVWSAELYLL